MAIKRPDIYEHNNANLAISDTDFHRGGFRSAVASVNDLYALSGKTGFPSAPGQLKEHSTIVYVSGETKYYVLTDIDNVGNASGWSEFQTGGGGGTGTLSGATNGLSLANTGTTVVLGGNLTGNTELNGLGLHNFTFDNINDFQITPSGSSNIIFGVDESGLLFSFTGGSVGYDNNQGLVYGGDYTTTFTNESLVSKRYVDAIAAGLHPKTAVLVTTTGETLSLSGLTTVDGVALTSGDRVLVKNQTNDVENGIYVVSSTTGWTRSTDFDGTPDGEVEQGALVPVISGDTNKSTQWILITKDPDVGTSGLTFTLFSSPVELEAGVGIGITGQTIAVDGNSLAGNSITWSANTFNVDPSTGTLATALGSKLDINTFTGYTATTSQAITDIENDITYISGQTDTKLNTTDFNTFTGTTLPANYYNETEINTYTGATDIRLDNIEDITSIALTGATNGLGLDGRDVCIGGALSDDTQVDIDLGDFELCGSSNQSFKFGNLGMTLGFNGSCIYLTNSGNDFLIRHRSGTCIDINRSGLTYGGTSYSESNFCDNTLVTKNYVDNSTGALSGDNGLSRDGNNIVLGGTLTGNTDIAGGGNILCLGTAASKLSTFCTITTSETCINAGTNLKLNATSCLQLNYGGGFKQIELDTNQMLVSDGETFKGLEYAANYCAVGKINPRWIPDNEYVTGYTDNAVTQNSNVLSIYEVTTTGYTATTQSDFIGASGGTTIYLPDDPKAGQRIVVADIAGDALSDSISIRSLGDTHTIIGSTSATINTDYGSITFIFNGNFWSAAAFIN